MRARAIRRARGGEASANGRCGRPRDDSSSVCRALVERGAPISMATLSGRRPRFRFPVRGVYCKARDLLRSVFYRSDVARDYICQANSETADRKTTRDQRPGFSYNLGFQPVLRSASRPSNGCRLSEISRRSDRMSLAKPRASPLFTGTFPFTRIRTASSCASCSEIIHFMLYTRTGQHTVRVGFTWRHK